MGTCRSCKLEIEEADRACKHCGAPLIFGSGYRVIERKGAGSFAILYKCLDPKLDRAVALKVLKRDEIPSSRLAEARLNLRNEANLQAKLADPRIVPIIDIDESELFIVQSYIDGMSLGKREEEEPGFCRKNFASVFRQICEGLAAAHALGILHRDLTYENILISRNNAIFLTDFGLARILSTGANAFTAAGTPWYMAPEVWDSKEQDDKCDIYSLGILTYHMWTGGFPFNGTTITQVMKGHLFEAPVLPTILDPSIPGFVDELIINTLAKEPAHRFASVADCLRVLNGYASHNQTHGSMDAIQQRLSYIYGPINGKRHPISLVAYIEVGIGKLVRAVVPGAAVQALEPTDVVRPFAWLIGLANKFRFSASEALWAKYPGVCGYCGGAPCTCDRYVHAPYQKRESRGVAPKGFEAYRKLFLRLYPPDRREPLEIALRLSLEVAELAEAVLKYESLRRDGKEAALLDEFADVLAWLFALLSRCNVLVDVDKTLSSIYTDGCPHCKQDICKCDEIDPNYRLLSV